MSYYTTTDPILRKTVDDLNAAKERQLARLRELYPVGTRVAVKLSSVQKHPSLATVVAHDSDFYGGDVVVHLDNEKLNSRYRNRSIAPQYISIL